MRHSDLKGSILYIRDTDRLPADVYRAGKGKRIHFPGPAQKGDPSDPPDLYTAAIFCG